MAAGTVAAAVAAIAGKFYFGLNEVMAWEQLFSGLCFCVANALVLNVEIFYNKENRNSQVKVRTPERRDMEEVCASPVVGLKTGGEAVKGFGSGVFQG